MPRQADPNRARLRPLPFLTPLWLATAVAAQGIGWEPSLDYALEAAAAKQKVILVAVVMPGERGSEGIIAHYRDAALGKLCRECVCLRIDVGGERPSDDERAVLERYLGAAPREPIVVPHHFIVHPDGRTVLSSAAHQMTAGQLEWFVADGIRHFAPSFQWPLSDRARAPEGLRYGDVEKTQEQPAPPPTADEVKHAIAELKKGGSGWQGAIQHYTVLLRSDEASAIKYVDTQLKGGRGAVMKGMALTVIAEMSPIEWAPMLSQFLDDRNAAHRETAARGLAKMAHDKSNKAVKKQLKGEQEPKVKAWLLRAAVATAPKDKATITAIEKAIADEKEADVRMHAAVAAGAVEDRDAARRLLQQALRDGDPMVRAAAAYAMAGCRDKEYVPALEAALAGEGDAETKHWLDRAIDTLANERDLREFENFRSKVLGERTSLDRNRGGGQPGGGGAPGGGVPGGGVPGGGNGGGNQPGGGGQGGEDRVDQDATIGSF